MYLASEQSKNQETTLAIVNNEAKEIKSPLLGLISYTEDSVLVFPEGLIGLEANTRYISVDIPEYKPFKWLLCLDDPSLAFPIMEPFLFMPGYDVGLSDANLRTIGLTSMPQAEIFAIVTIGNSMEEVTANLRGPIVINKMNRLGKQFILSDSSFSLRHKILPDPPGQRYESQGRQDHVNTTSENR